MNADRAVKTVLEIMLDESVPAAVRLNAAKDIIDRNGKELSNEGATVTIEVKPYERTFARAVRHNRPGGDDDEEDRYSSMEAGTLADIVDAEVVEDVQADPPRDDDSIIARPTRLTKKTTQPEPAMMSQVDLQSDDGPTTRSTGRRNHPTDLRR